MRAEGFGIPAMMRPAVESSSLVGERAVAFRSRAPPQRSRRDEFKRLFARTSDGLKRLVRHQAEGKEL
jgi:hypothetical protein